jgi:flagellar basal body-associated protein FliL
MDLERIRPRRGDSVWILLLLLLLIVSLVFNLYQYRTYRKEVVRYEIMMDSVITLRVNVEK